MPNTRRRLVGRVVSDKMDKTVVVAIETRTTHPIYRKVVKSTKKVMAHDESNAIVVGSVVRIVESRPLSRRKRWVVEQVLETVATVAPVVTQSDLTADAVDGDEQQ